VIGSKANVRRRKFANQVFSFVCFAAAGIAVLMLFVLLAKIVVDGSKRLDWAMISNMPSQIFPKKAGIKSSMVGSLVVMALTAVITVPIGVAAAVYLEEFASKRNKLIGFIQVNIANLSGVPSIVYGMLGLAAFVAWMGLGQSILVGALTMSLLILPTVILVSQEALKAVPSSFRDGSMALGTTKWETIRRMVLPSAAPGILTGIILSLSRAIGETAPLIVVGAVGLVTFLPKGLMDRYTVLPLQIFDWSNRPQADFRDAAAGAIIVLMVLLLTMNGIAIIIRSRAQKRL